MDENTANKNWLESAWEDFHSFLVEKDWDNARAVMDSVGENGFENDALKMHKLVNSSMDEWEKMSKEEKLAWAHKENEKEDLAAEPHDVW